MIENAVTRDRLDLLHMACGREPPVSSDCPCLLIKSADDTEGLLHEVAVFGPCAGWEPPNELI
jgi:hypothetical protein